MVLLAPLRLLSLIKLEKPTFGARQQTMSENISFKLANGKTISARLEVKDGIVTVTAGDGRTRALDMENSMLSRGTSARILLLQLHDDDPREE